MTVPPKNSLDPDDWQALRAQGHRMLDDILDYAEHIRERPVWQVIPDEVRAKFQSGLPIAPAELGEVHQQFMKNILPYSVGNSHPGFMGWVQGGGSPVGTLAEMLAAGLNANLGGRDHIPIEVERQITRWVSELFHFPDTASGLFVTGTSMANFIAVLVARARTLGAEVRHQGLTAFPERLVAYTSAGAHGCVAQAMDMAGIGRNALRMIPMNGNFQMDVGALQAAIVADRAAGLTPFMLVGTAGSVDVGAIDDLQTLADVASTEKLWFHIDGAFGALGMLSPFIAARLVGIERADSIAFDFHKWLQVPYDAGFILVRDSDAHYATFATPASYLRRESKGLAGGSPWPCDFGPDLSRGFRALKTWFTLQVYGAERLGQMIAHTCELGQYLKASILAYPRFELMAPVALNIVCFRYLVDGLSDEALDALNARIVMALQESGIAAPSTTIINKRLAIRAAIVNHRTTSADIDALLNATLAIGEQIHTSRD
ncbi:cytochrome d ubiquinol oxidase subunit I [Undibacterium sp. KW1]|uniref:pyridoxal phosphate-dependent decarboxylase family protein n=1 Tax=Undibacterium sp. KW1 TaxID=2058624 RepID=UPI001331F622|nr:pyridoxal-dependent decarboxylase [Undibacterium sp. KW1]BBB59885.1 cytochrome d ubiquinol oxidase subunit I [Undibacterium sp. KW1]